MKLIGHREPMDTIIAILPLPPDGLTPVLVNSITPNNTAPDGYTLQVTIIAEGIQSRGMGETVTTAQAAFAKAAE